MPAPKFIVSSRATKGGPTQQVTIPAAIARKLPQNVSIRWEVAVVKGGLFFKYLGPNADTSPDAPEIELDFVPAGDLKAVGAAPTRKKKAAPVEETAAVVEEPEVVEEDAAVEDAATDSTAEQEEDAVEVEDDAVLDEAPF